MNVVAPILDRWNALSSRERHYLAAGMLALAGFVMIKWVALPVRAEYLRNRAAIPVRRAMLARYKAIRQDQGAADNTLIDLGSRLYYQEETLLPGETLSVAGIALQGILKPILSKPPTRVTSVRTMPPVKNGPYTEIPIQVDLQTSTPGLALLLADLGRQGKITRIDKFSVIAVNYFTLGAAAKDTLSVALTVAGLSDVPLEDPATGPGGNR